MSSEPNDCVDHFEEVPLETLGVRLLDRFSLLGSIAEDEVSRVGESLLSDLGVFLQHTEVNIGDHVAECLLLVGFLVDARHFPGVILESFSLQEVLQFLHLFKLLLTLELLSLEVLVIILGEHLKLCLLGLVVRLLHLIGRHIGHKVGLHGRLSNVVKHLVLIGILEGLVSCQLFLQHTMEHLLVLELLFKSEESRSDAVLLLGLVDVGTVLKDKAFLRVEVLENVLVDLCLMSLLLDFFFLLLLELFHFFFPL